MSNRIVVTKYESKYIIVFIKDNIAIKIRAIDDYRELSDIVYLGRVESVKNNISSSFIRYKDGTGFINNSNRKCETVFPVMIKKEASGDKENALTDKITLCGLYSIVSETINGVKFSNKVGESFKNQFDYFELKNVIIRNNAQNTDYDSVINEYHYLISELQRINNIYDKRTENNILYNGLPKLINIIFSEDISEYSEILTDDKDIYDYIDSFFSEYSKKNINMTLPLKLYSDDLVSLKAFISLSSKIDRALNRKVYLDSSAFLIFDYTEAMTVIDVNSGTTRFKGDKQTVIHNINLEAAKEIALQIKLRNLSGIIIIDFINEIDKNKSNELVSFLRKELKNDDSHAKCHGITNLGLIEITRDRKTKPLREQLWK